MTVYVDTPIWQRHHGLSGHMIADTQAELLAMADRLLLPKNTYMPDAVTPHVQLPAGLRDAAIAAGAVALDRPKFMAKARLSSEAAFNERRSTRPPARSRSEPMQQELL